MTGAFFFGVAFGIVASAIGAIAYRAWKKQAKTATEA